MSGYKLSNFPNPEQYRSPQEAPVPKQPKSAPENPAATGKVSRLDEILAAYEPTVSIDRISLAKVKRAKHKPPTRQESANQEQEAAPSWDPLSAPLSTMPEPVETETTPTIEQTAVTEPLVSRESSATAPETSNPSNRGPAATDSEVSESEGTAPEASVEIRTDGEPVASEETPITPAAAVAMTVIEPVVESTEPPEVAVPEVVLPEVAAPEIAASEVVVSKADVPVPQTAGAVADRVMPFAPTVSTSGSATPPVRTSRPRILRDPGPVEPTQPQTSRVTDFMPYSNSANVKTKEPQKESRMLDLDIAHLEKVVAETKALLKDGLKATDIWDVETGLSLAGHNPQPEAVALFNLLTNEIQTTLAGSGFPGLARYYTLDLADDNIVVVQLHGKDLMSGMLLDAKLVNLGILVSVAIPRYAAGVEAARGKR